MNQSTEHRLVIGCRDRLHVFSFDCVDNRIQERATLSVPSLKAVLPWNKRLIVSSEHGACTYTDDLQEYSTPFQGSFAAAASTTETAFFAVDGAVVCCDREMREIGRVILLDGHKDAHDLLPCGPRLYALDNLVYPVYTVLVNTSDPKRLAVVTRNEITSVYPHLDAQFVDPESHLWFVLQSSSHRGGFGQDLHCFSSDTGRQLLGDVPLFFSHRHGDGPEVQTPAKAYLDRVEIPFSSTQVQGTSEVRFHATSAVIPCWTVVSEPHADLDAIPYYLCRVSVQVGSLVLDRFISLPFSGPTKLICVAESGDLTFVVAEVMTGTWEEPSSYIHVVVTSGEIARLVYDQVILADAGTSRELVDASVWDR